VIRLGEGINWSHPEPADVPEPEPDQSGERHAELVAELRELRDALRRPRRKTVIRDQHGDIAEIVEEDHG
jgi:hypothetical protein